jgi:hypothetical protein
MPDPSVQPPEGLRVVYLVVNQLTPWQRTSEAIYGPFTEGQEAVFCDWLHDELRDVGWVRLATFPLSVVSVVSYPENQEDGD